MHASNNSDFKDRIFWLKQRWGRRRAYRYYQQLLENESRSPDEILAINWEKRKRLLQYAYERIPFYRKRFQSLGLNPSDVRDVNDWNCVPILTKRNLVEHVHDLMSPDVRDSDRYSISTGGSTGVPTTVYHDARYPVEALGWRMLHWWGLSYGSHAAYARRLGKKSMAQRVINYAIWWPTKRIWLDASSMTPEATRHFVAQFKRLRPALLQGYVGAITHLADYIETNELVVPSPKAVWVTSTPMAVVQRSLIERVFQAPVYDQYGCCEIFWLAAECSHHQGLHMFSDARHIEFVDQNNRVCEVGQTGRIIVTDLENYAFPLIRYENGDEGRQLPSTCECGVHLPLMDAVKGRITDTVRVPGNIVVSGEYLTTIFDDFPDAVRAFQVVQQEDWSLLLRVIPSTDEHRLTLAVENAKSALAQRTKHRVPIRVESVREIPSDRGKLKYVISHAKGSPPE